MDIGTEEFSHFEIVGATITMLLNWVSAELKNAAERSDLMRLLKSPAQKMIHQAMVSLQLLVLSGGGPTLTNSQGVPWSGTYIEAATSRWICAPASPPSRAPRSSMST